MVDSPVYRLGSVIDVVSTRASRWKVVIHTALSSADQMWREDGVLEHLERPGI